MKTKHYLIAFVLLLFGTVVLVGCGGRNTGGNGVDSINEPDSISAVISKSPIKYNIFVENSGSVKGYFNGKSNDASVVLKQFYDRIDENKGDDDTITLNYINNTIQNQATDIDTWLNDIYKNCNQSFSDLDKVLDQVLSNTDSSTVNIVVSDFCFESKDGNLEKAKSEITKVFTKGLKSFKDLSIAIFKFDTSFDGFYFPGKIKYTGKRPLYFWIFGPSLDVKRVSNLPITYPSMAKMFKQPTAVFNAKVVTNNARMTNKERQAIIVKHWDADRREPGVYKAYLEVDLSHVIIPDSEIKNIGNYKVTPEEFSLEEIKDNENGHFVYTISTKHPHACNLNISYLPNIPSWVEESNFEQNTMPDSGKTYGIKSLIEGASNAYTNKSENVFNIKLSLQ